MVARVEVPEDAFFAVEGGLYSCPLDAVVEYGVDAAFPTDIVFHGIVKENGATVSLSTSTTDHKGWGGARVYRKTVDGSDATIALNLVEYNNVNYSLYTGKTLNVTTGGYHIDASVLGDHRQFFLCGEDTTGKMVRQYLPDGQVTERGDRTFAGTEATGFDLVITAYSKVVAGERANIVEFYGVATPVVP